MKKFAAILLAMLMLLSFAALAACTDRETPGPQGGTSTDTDTDTDRDTGPDTGPDVGPDDGGITEEVLRASKPNEYVREKLDAGWEMRIDWSLHQDNFFTHTQLAEGALEQFAEYGFVGQIYCADNNSITNQIIQLENMLTVGNCCGVCIQTSDPDALENIVGQLQDAGITVVVYGIECAYPTIVATADVYNAGYGVGVMASAWVDARYPDAGPGDIHTAGLGGSSNIPNQTLSRGMRDALEEDDRFLITYWGDDEGSTMEQSYNGAQAAMLTDDAIRVFAVYQMSGALGVNNFLEAQGYDLTEFGVFGTSEDDTTAGLLQAAVEGTSAFRGTVCAGGGVPDTIVNVMIEALLGDGVPLGTMVVDPMYAWTSSDYTCDFTIGDVSGIEMKR